MNCWTITLALTDSRRDDAGMNRGRTRWLLWALSLAPLVTILWLRVQSPVPDPDPGTAEALEVAARQWWEPGDSTRTIPEGDWPPRLRRLGPEAVRVSPEGVFIPFASHWVEEWGLFVLPPGSDFRPQQRTDPSFHFVRGRIYKYNIKG